MRIGIIFPATDPLSPSSWSGIPHGLAAGLAAHGVETVPIGVSAPRGLRGPVAVLTGAVGRAGKAAAWLGIDRCVITRAVAKRFARASPLDAVVAMGSEMYDIHPILDPIVSLVTFDDATIAQQSREPQSDVMQARLPGKALAQAVASQRAAARAATVCCVTTHWAAESFRTDLGVPADRVAVIGMGHRPRSTAVPVNRNWSVPRFLFVGADWHRKNGAAVLDAFAAVRDRFPAATLDLVGDHPRVDQPGVIPHGFLAREDHAAQRRLDRLYADATCFVLPSLFDAAGIAYLEAASAGIPVVVTNRGGAPEMVRGGAAVVDPYDPVALRAAMLSLADPETARTMGGEACRSVASASWQTVAGRLIDALATYRMDRVGS